MRPVRPPFIELRQYVIAPGRRARMVELFDAHFAAAQNALGLPILGQFTVAGDPDRLVWLRGLPDMQSRPELLGAFYGGPVWTEFGPEAIGMVTGYDNVQLLREATPGSGIEVGLDERPPSTQAVPVQPVFATTYRLTAPASDNLVQTCRDTLQATPGLHLLGLYVSDPTPNNFPVLPIREGEYLLTWFSRGESAIDEDALGVVFDGEPERLVLGPTAGSLLR